MTQIRYYQGEVFFKTGEYEPAKILFQEALEYARATDWRRAIFCTQNWLADIAIEQGALDEAQRLLSEGLHMAEANKDKFRQKLSPNKPQTSLLSTYTYTQIL